ADDLDIPQHVLRFWETRFTQIKPMKRSGGRRYYRPDDVDLLRGIRRLLYGEGYTIRGVQRILKENGIKAVQGLVDGAAAPAFAAPGRDAKRAPVADERDDDLAAEIEIDDEDEEDEAPPVVARHEPELAVRREPAMQARREPERAPRREPEVTPRREPEMMVRREPEISAPARMEAPRPAPLPEPRQPVPVIDHAARQRDRARLQTVLQDLLACRQALDAAMKEG
ncbi:MAG: transcriptional regulator, MerR family, partial [Tardiphaga sp.]|nr:transcriptional regulator, MerR family [Tardiphaga sp.]